MLIQRQQKTGISQFFRLIIFICSVGIIIGTLILNGLMKQSLYKMGVNIIYYNQQIFESQIFVIVNNLFSMMCHPSTVAILIFFQIAVVRHKLKAFIHISFFLLCIYWIALLKQAYQQSRPIWSSYSIKKLQWFCPKDFGNPSGHSFAIFPLWEPLISKYIGFENYKSGWMILVIFAFCVPFSRTYLGVHSVNQVMFGLTLGIAATVLYRYGIRRYFYYVFARIYKKKSLRYFFFTLLLHILCFFLPFLVFQIYSENKPINQSDLNNLNQFCISDLTSVLIQESMLLKCTLQSFIFGIAYGLYFLEYTHQDLLYFSGRWEYKRVNGAFFHILSIVGICGSIALIFIIVIPHFSEDILLDYTSNTIGMLLSGFSLVFFIPKLERCFNWIQYQGLSTQIKSSALSNQYKQLSLRDNI